MTSLWDNFSLSQNCHKITPNLALCPNFANSHKSWKVVKSRIEYCAGVYRKDSLAKVLVFSKILTGSAKDFARERFLTHENL